MDLDALLDEVLAKAGEVCDATGEIAINESLHPTMRELIGELQDALHYYDSACQERDDPEGYAVDGTNAETIGDEHYPKDSFEWRAIRPDHGH